MSEHIPFVGVGPNPNGPDLPLGLGMRLAQEPRAMEVYGRLTNPQKESVIGYIQSCETGDDSKSRIEQVIKLLGEDNPDAIFWLS